MILFSSISFFFLGIFAREMFLVRFLDTNNLTIQSIQKTNSEQFFHSLKEYVDYYGFKIILPEGWFFDAEIARGKDGTVTPYYSLRKGRYLLKDDTPVRIYLSSETDLKPKTPLEQLYKTDLVEGKNQTLKSMVINGLEVYLRSRVYAGVFAGEPDYTRHTLYVRLKKHILNLRFHEEKDGKENMKDFEKIYQSISFQ